jgi:hypothetical protein
MRPVRGAEASAPRQAIGRCRQNDDADDDNDETKRLLAFKHTDILLGVMLLVKVFEFRSDSSFRPDRKSLMDKSAFSGRDGQPIIQTLSCLTKIKGIINLS